MWFVYSPYYNDVGHGASASGSISIYSCTPLIVGVAHDGRGRVSEVDLGADNLDLGLWVENLVVKG